MPKPLIADLPYPSVDKLTTDIRSASIISFAYASLHGEMTAINQYIYHSFYFEKYGQEYADLMESIAMAEMKHLDILGKAMLNMGHDPQYRQSPAPNSDYYNTSTVAYSKTPQKMLMDDIAGELNAIADYQKMLYILTNEQVSAIIQRILLDEQLHLAALKDMLEKFSK